MSENNYSEDNIEVMAKHPKKEGLEKDQLLPKGWYTRAENDLKESKFNYLSDNFQPMQSNSVPMEVLKSSASSSDKDVEKIIFKETFNCWLNISLRTLGDT